MKFIYDALSKQFTFHNAFFLWDWMTGYEPRSREYGEDDIQTQEMMESRGVARIRESFYKNNCQSLTGRSYGGWRVPVETFLHPLSTPLQVGGFAGASVTNNGNGTMTFLITNIAGTKSFFYHGFPDRKSKTGPMSNFRQTFQWTEKIEPNRCGK